MFWQYCKNKNFTVYSPSLGKRLHSITNHLTPPLVPIDHRAVNSLWVSYCLLPLIHLIIPSWFSFFKEKSSMYIQVDRKHICVLGPLSFLLHLLYTHLSLLWVFVPVFYSLPAPSLFSYFAVNGLISFYAGAQQINRYCIMAKTGKAPFCPWHLINGNPLICCL